MHHSANKKIGIPERLVKSNLLAKGPLTSQCTVSPPGAFFFHLWLIETRRVTQHCCHSSFPSPPKAVFLLMIGVYLEAEAR